MHCELLEFAVFAQDIACIGGLVAPYFTSPGPEALARFGAFPLAVLARCWSRGLSNASQLISKQMSDFSGHVFQQAPVLGCVTHPSGNDCRMNS